MSVSQKPPLVVTSGDEGVQLNAGTRFGFVGSGYQLPHFDLAIKALRQASGQELVLASTQEDDWLAEKLQSRNPNLYQETLENFAQEQKLTYVGQLDYGDPRDLSDGQTRGHLVRPQKIHVADQLLFTIGGGEQNYNLRQVVVSADYLFALSEDQAKEMIDLQVSFYQKVLAKELKFVVEKAGAWDEKLKKDNELKLKAIIDF